MNADFITDEQIAEIEQSCIDEGNKGHSLVIKCNELAALISRLRAAERDAERYRWLREQDNDDFEFAVVSTPHFDVFGSSSELDQAIDTAMKGER